MERYIRGTKAKAATGLMDHLQAKGVRVLTVGYAEHGGAKVLQVQTPHDASELPAEWLGFKVVKLSAEQVAEMERAVSLALERPVAERPRGSRHSTEGWG